MVTFLFRIDKLALLKTVAVMVVLNGLWSIFPSLYAANDLANGNGTYCLLLASALPLTICVAVCFRKNLNRRLRFAELPKVRPHHSACVIWLHGLGDCGKGFAFLRSEMSLSLPHVRWALPTAGRVNVTAASSVAMQAWIDVPTLPVTPGQPADRAQLDAAVARVQGLVDLVVAQGTPPDRIVLGGFSQGGAVALWAAARSPRRLAGVLLWSSYAPLADELAHALGSCASRRAPVLVCHGDSDVKVAPTCRTEVSGTLAAAGVPHATKVYAGMGHSCCTPQLSDAAEFLARVLPPAPRNRKPKAE